MNTLYSRMKLSLLFAWMALLALFGCRQELEVVVEKQVQCPVAGLVKEACQTIQDTKLGTMSAGCVFTWTYPCDEPYLKGKGVALGDSYSYAGTDHQEYWQEIITDEGGLWRGTCEMNTTDLITRCQLEGAGKYQGLRMASEANELTGEVNFSIFFPSTATPK